MKKRYYIASLIVLVLAVVVTLNVEKARALFSQFTTGTLNSTASTTVAYMSAGAGTTTYNLYNAAAYDLDNDVDANQLFIQFTASNTPSTLDWQYEFSNDAVDWFEEDIPLTLAAGGSQATQYHASTTITHEWRPGSATASTSRKTLVVPRNVSRYKRVVFTIPAGSTAGSLWVMDNRYRLPTGN